MELCKKWIEKHKISEARSSLFYVLLMNVHGIGSANHKSALLLFPHYPRVGKASWSRLNSPRGFPPPPRAPRPSPRPRPSPLGAHHPRPHGAPCKGDALLHHHARGHLVHV